MPDLSQEERIKLAVSLIEQSPPGEVNDVVAAIRAIIGDDEALMPHATPALRAYNLSQLHVVEHSDGKPHKSLISNATRHPNSSEERFIDAEGGRSFTYDHVTLVPGGYEPYTLPEKEREFRELLGTSWGKYARNHYPSGVASVSTDQIPLVAKKEVAATPGSEDLASPKAGVSSPAAEKEEYPAGIAEIDSTPLEGEKELEGKDEVDKGDGLEKLDDEMEEVKEAEEAEAASESSPKEVYPSGIAEAEPTPIAPHEKDLNGQNEVDKGDGLEKLDDEMDEVKAETEAVKLEATEEKEEEIEKKREGADAQVEAEEAVVALEKDVAPLENPAYTLEIVGNRYSPTNYWTGRWRTRWVVSDSTVSGEINVDVHYYEQGNVQLSTNHATSFPLPEATGQALASAIVTNIAKIETEYQLELGEVYSDLGDRAFRALRRALPVTRQKLDWDKVSGYGLGSDISKGRA